MNWEFARFWKKQQTKAAAAPAATTRAADGTITVVLDDLKDCWLPDPIEQEVKRRQAEKSLWDYRVAEMKRLLPVGYRFMYAGTTFTVVHYNPAVCEFSFSRGSAGSATSFVSTYREPPTIEPTLVTHYTDWLGVFHTHVFEYGEWGTLAAAKRAENEKGDAQ
jgi:hypothetical protein